MPHLDSEVCNISSLVTLPPWPYPQLRLSFSDSPRPVCLLPVQRILPFAQRNLPVLRPRPDHHCAGMSSLRPFVQPFQIKSQFHPSTASSALPSDHLPQLLECLQNYLETIFGCIVSFVPRLRRYLLTLDSTLSSSTQCLAHNGN